MANADTLYLGRLAWCQKSQDGSEVLPPYMASGGYLLAQNLVSRISVVDKDVALKEGQQEIEGASVGLWLHRHANTHFLALHSRSKGDSMAAGCKESDVLSFGLSAEEIECMWKQQAQVGGICCRSTERRNFGAEE